jgi:hypothetical protein
MQYLHYYKSCRVFFLLMPNAQQNGLSSTKPDRSQVARFLCDAEASMRRPFPQPSLTNNGFVLGSAH